jgi:hypothetical protein
MRDEYPETVTCHPEFIRTLITGRMGELHWGYDVCPSVSRSHPANKERFGNGQPALPGFEVWGADQETIQLCCASAVAANAAISCGDLLVADDQPRASTRARSLVTWGRGSQRHGRQFVVYGTTWGRTAENIPAAPGSVSRSWLPGTSVIERPAA